MVETHNDTIRTSDSHHVGVRINRDGSSNEKVRGVFLMDLEGDSTSLELAVDDLMGLLVSLDSLQVKVTYSSGTFQA
jgi:hypothetical protein